MATKGKVPRMASAYFCLKMAMAVKILQPKGGVVDPMAACRVTMMPHRILSNPAAAIAGLKMGVRIMMTTMGSTNMQARKYVMVRTNMMRTDEGASPRSAGRIMLGIRPKEMVQEKACPMATRMKTMEAAFYSISLK